MGSTVAFIGVLGITIGLFLWGVVHVSQNKSRAGVWAGGAALIWLAVTGGYVAAGGTRLGAPGLMGFFMLGNLGAVALAFTPFATRLIDGLPLWALAAFQAFRFPLELVLHQWGTEGTMPIQMTFEGHNFDIVSGLFGLGVAVLVLLTKKEPPRWLLWLFNTVGSALLVAVIVIVVLSSPLPVKQYEGPPILIALFLPYAWIAPICVAGAVAAHVMLWRGLFRTRRSA